MGHLLDILSKLHIVISQVILRSIDPGQLDPLVMKGATMRTQTTIMGTTIILIIGMLALLTPKFSHRAVPAPDMHISMPKKNPTMQGQVTICTAGVAFLLVPPAGVF